MNLGQWDVRMRWTAVPCNSQLYSEYQTIYSLRVFLRVKQGQKSKGHMSLSHTLTVMGQVMLGNIILDTSG